MEVVSPSDTYAEVEEKALDWLAGGSQVVLVVKPHKRTVAVYRSVSNITIIDKNSVLDLSDVVTDFKVAVRALFD